jgi:putative GTP pyrophosphokinase
LREGVPTDADLTFLDEYRLSFVPAYERVVRIVREQLHLEPTGRPAKSTSSLLDKLNRESIRLTQVQDIAGCRILVDDMVEQERVVNALESLFHQVSVVDRRSKSSFGYRAVHVIVKISEKLVEVQVRTRMQHMWAELSEKGSDVIEPTIKYGGGPKEVRSMLLSMSDYIANIEEMEYNAPRVRAEIQEHLLQEHSSEDDYGLQKQLDENDLRILEVKNDLVKECKDLMTWLDQHRGSRP